MQRQSPPSLAPEPVDQDDASALLTRFGTVVGGGVAAALLASLPAVMRIGDGGSAARALDEWVATASLLTPVAILAVGVLRRARHGLRLLVGDHTVALAAAVLWWAVIESSVLAAFGAVLRAKTHHHGLAGVTFAAAALVSGVLVALLAARGGRMIERMPPAARRIGIGLASAAAFLVVLLVGIRTARAEGMHTAAGLVDVLALAVTSAVASARPLSRLRAVALVGVPLSVLVVVLGFSALHRSPSLETAILDAAPIHGFVLSALAR
jgi:hypothetical protein